jgi:hypothetical protein
MEWWELPKYEFPKNVIFTAGNSDPDKKAKKRTSRQQLYIDNSLFNEKLQSKYSLLRQKQKPQPKPKLRPKEVTPTPIQIQEPHTEVINLSESVRPWPALRKTITVYPPPPLRFFNEEPHGPQKPPWFRFLLPIFQHLAPCGIPYVPHSSYLNIRLHALNDIYSKRLFTTKGPNTYGPWLLGQVLRILIPMLRVRRLIRHFIQLYRCRQCDRRAERLDPFTLCETISPIHVYCFKTKKRYDYDPISIVRHICTSLRYQNSGFADPRIPKIPQTNEPLTAGQLTSIHNQACKKGISSQVLNNYRSVQWNLLGFTHIFSNELQRYAIRNEHFASDSFIARENITYWIETSAITEGIYLEDDDYKLIQYSLDNHYNHTYLLAWRGIIMNYLSECNTFPNSTERKTHAKVYFHKKCVQLLRLFCDFRNQMISLRDKQNDIFNSSSDEDEDASSQEE